VRLRSLVTPLVCACALFAPAGAAAYPWPVKPFNKAHPVRGNFGDPRTIFSLSLFTRGLEGPGDFQFHNGVDISAKDGTPVYPVVSGKVNLIEDGTEIAVRTDDDRVFQYFHLVPAVFEGQDVVAKRTVLGYVARTFGHVHLTEIRGFRVWNPLARGGLAPYADSTKPRVTSVFMRAEGSIAPLDPLGVCGTVSIVAEAYDWPTLKVPGTFAGFPVSPALVTWSMRKVGAGVLQPDIPAFDVRTGLPPKPEFWDLYARGTYQNAPRFANRQFNLMPGRFLYNLNTAFDTRTVANGVYQVSAAAEDERGNRTFLNQRFTIVNQANTETGCPPA
jgi:murein DD-endopeptidase MepM/ murein hydrolase activator NlpD